MNPGRDPAAPELPGYGGFTVAGMALALPMDALREVVPCQGLVPLPCPEPAVQGGVDLRGTRVPVLDLTALLGGTLQPPSPGSCVLVLAHQGRLLGLLADHVTGVFQAAPDSLAQAEATDPVAAILAGSVRRDDNGDLLSLLSLHALTQLPQVPWVRDRDPTRAVHGSEGNPTDADAAVQATTLVLLQCGRLPLALHAMRVHATVPDPALRPSVLAQGHCRGVMGYGGRDVPAVDLLAACGLGQLPLDGPLQAVLVQAGGGLVAFLVEQVVDVVRVDAAAVVPVPALALAQPGCVAGALPLSALSPELVARLGDGAPQFLVLSAQALQDDEHMAGLGSTCSGERQAAGAARLGSRRAPQRRMLTYELDGEGGGEAATPIEQIVEILAFESEASVLAGGDALLGLQLHRGHAIPVMCLSQLQGRAPRPTAPGTRVLVVDCAHGRLGFAVPRLRSIEAAEWSDAAASGEPATGTRSLARVDDGGSSRMVRVLDLQHLAARLSASRAAQVLAPAEPAALAAA